MIVPAHPKKDVNASRTDKEKKVRKKEENRNTWSSSLSLDNNVHAPVLAIWLVHMSTTCGLGEEPCSPYLRKSTMACAASDIHVAPTPSAR